MNTPSNDMNVVMIVPTGIGCEIGGHCGDGNAAAGMIMAMKAGVHPATVRRPLAFTTVLKAHT